jgi:amino acid transporter
MWGEWAATVVALAAVISSLGALNGWTLLLARVPMAAAHDGAMPAIFGRISSTGVPVHGLAISVGLSTLLLLLGASGRSAMLGFYDLVVDLSTDAAMIPYVFCSVVEAILYLARRPISRALRIGPFMPVAIVAFVFSIGTIYGAGASAGMWSLILVLLATPLWTLLFDKSDASLVAPDRSLLTGPRLQPLHEHAVYEAEREHDADQGSAAPEESVHELPPGRA